MLADSNFLTTKWSDVKEMEVVPADTVSIIILIGTSLIESHTHDEVKSG